MRWQLFDVAHAPIIAEIEKQGDRAAAIVATAFLEEQLTEALKASLADEPQIIAKMFKGQGPLATLSAKIDMGLLIGLYKRQDHRQLRTIGTIRNRFAHSAKPVTFKSQDIADLCNNLPAPVRLRPPRINDKEEERLFETDTTAWTIMWTKWMASGKDTPRNRFLIAVRLHYFRFSVLLLMKKPEPQPASPDKLPSKSRH